MASTATVRRKTCVVKADLVPMAPVRGKANAAHSPKDAAPMAPAMANAATVRRKTCVAKADLAPMALARGMASAANIPKDAGPMPRVMEIAGPKPASTMARRAKAQARATETAAKADRVPTVPARGRVNAARSPKAAARMARRVMASVVPMRGVTTGHGPMEMARVTSRTSIIASTPPNLIAIALRKASAG